MHRKGLEKQIPQSNQNMETILHNVQQALLAFNQNGDSNGICSKAALDIFGIDPVGKNISEILRLHHNASESVQEWFKLLFQELLPFEDVKPLGPKSFEKHQDRFIELDYQPIRDEQGKLIKILVIGTDKTEERYLQRIATEEEDFVKMMIAIMQNKSFFFQFILDTRKKISDLRSRLLKPAQIFDTEDAFRLVHTIRGNSSLYKFSAISIITDQLEKILSELRSTHPDHYAELLIPFGPALDKIEKVLKGFLNEHKDVIGSIEDLDGKEKYISNKKICSMALLIKREYGENSLLYLEFLADFVLNPIHQYFEKFKQMIENMATQKNKIIKYTTVPSDIKILDDAYKALFLSLVHAFRNAIDHGIESKNEREELGKNPVGAIKVSFNTTENNKIIIRINDDGRGLDLEKIRSLTVAKELLSAAELEQINLHDIQQFVFQPGFSTNEKMQFSGRGVGLDAIKYEVTRLNGKVWIDSEPHQGTTINIEVPHLNKFA